MAASHVYIYIYIVVKVRISTSIGKEEAVDKAEAEAAVSPGRHMSAVSHSRYVCCLMWTHGLLWIAHDG